MKHLFISILSIFFTSVLTFSQSAEEYYQQGMEYLEKKEYTYAVSKFSRVFKSFPTDDEMYKAYLKRAYAKRMLKDFDEAIEDLNQAVNLFPEQKEAYYVRAEYKSILKDWASVAADYSRILKIDETDSEAYYLRGLTHKKLGNTEKACLDFKKAKEFNYNKDVKDLEQELSKCD